MTRFVFPILKLEKLSIIAIFSKILSLILFVRPNIFSFSHASVFRLLFRKKKWGKYGALLLLPNEVLFDAFKFLNRRQLTKLERVCLRFYRIISDHIGEAPFLRPDIGFGFSKRFLIFLPLKYARNPRKMQNSRKQYYFGDNFSVANH